MAYLNASTVADSLSRVSMVSVYNRILELYGSDELENETHHNEESRWLLIFCDQLERPGFTQTVARICVDMTEEHVEIDWFKPPLFCYTAKPKTPFKKQWVND